MTKQTKEKKKGRPIDRTGVLGTTSKTQKPRKGRDRMVKINTKEMKEEIKLIKCSRCGIPSPYGSAHLCDEYDYANHQLSTSLGKRILKWFMRGMTAN